MSTVPPFLQALELGPDADERAIRRAYAKRLKLIDAEVDPAGFQALRETFENALKWVAWQAQRTAATAAATAAAASSSAQTGAPVAEAAASTTRVDDEPRHRPASEPPASAPVTAGAAPQDNPADRVFAAFVSRFERGVEDEADAALQIETALADDRLVNLDARGFFEWRVACLVVGGWRPGHEHLFKPACDAFAWEVERRRLEVFGQVGAIVDAAIRERLICRNHAHNALYDRLIRRLRHDTPTSVSDLVTEIPLLMTMLQRYPNWMRVMTRQEVVQQWMDAWNALTPEQRKVPVFGTGAGTTAPSTGPTSTRMPMPMSQAQAKAKFNPTPAPGYQPARTGVGTRWLVVVAVIGMVRVFSTLGGSSPPAYAPSYSPTYTPPPATYRIPTPHPTLPGIGDMARQQTTLDFPSPYGDGTTPQATTNLYPDLGQPPAATPSKKTAHPADAAATQRQIEALTRQIQQGTAAVRAAPRDAQPAPRYDYRLAPTPDATSVPGSTSLGSPGSRYQPAPPVDYRLSTAPNADLTKGVAEPAKAKAADEPQP